MQGSRAQKRIAIVLCFAMGICAVSGPNDSQTGSHPSINDKCSDLVGKTSGATGEFVDNHSTPEIYGNGERVGDYEIIGFVGKGGMGEVYKVKRKGSGEIYALKVEKRQAKRGSGHRFERETDILSQLDHPNILKAHEKGTDLEENPYLITEYVEGKSLARILKDSGGQLPPEQAVKIVLQIADALEYAHSKGILHRDIKPENIMITSDGQVKLLDFGLAKSNVGENYTQTQQDVILGTPVYMSPEQAKSIEALPESDIYSLGITLYQMLAGKTPYKETSPLDYVNKHGSQNEVPSFRPPRNLKLGKLPEIVAKMVKKKPHQRYRNAGALKKDLQNWLDGRPATEAEQEVTGPWKISSELKGGWIRRHPKKAGVLIMASLVAGVTGGYFILNKSGTKNSGDPGDSLKTDPDFIPDFEIPEGDYDATKFCLETVKGIWHAGKCWCVLEDDETLIPSYVYKEKKNGERERIGLECKKVVRIHNKLKRSN